MLSRCPFSSIASPEILESLIEAYHLIDAQALVSVEKDFLFDGYARGRREGKAMNGNNAREGVVPMFLQELRTCCFVPQSPEFFSPLFPVFPLFLRIFSFPSTRPKVEEAEEVVDLSCSLQCEGSADDSLLEEVLCKLLCKFSYSIAVPLNVDGKACLRAPEENFLSRREGNVVEGDSEESTEGQQWQQRCRRDRGEHIDSLGTLVAFVPFTFLQGNVDVRFPYRSFR